MKWLILSNNKPDRESLSKTIRLRDEICTIEAYSLSKSDSAKWIPGLYDVTNLVIIADKSDLEKEETAGLLYSLAGYASGSGAQFFTTLPDLIKNTVILKETASSYKNFESLNKEISSEYVYILNRAKKHDAFKSLINAGIPFTIDCFADYISKGKFEICRLFLTAGMDINSRDNRGTPMLNIAVRTDNEEIVSWMVDNGARINVMSEDRGYTPVMDAVWRGNKEITQFLIEHGADLNTICKEGQSNLVIAVGSGKTQIVKLLADNGADPDIKDAMGMSAYEYSVLFKKDDITKILFPYHKIQ